MKKIVFFASGNGGNLKFFYLALQYNLISNIDLFVIADRECGSINFARKKKLNNYAICYSKTDTKVLNDILDTIEPDIIVTNWHKIIDELTVKKYAGKLINLHYSLLPAFAGLIGVDPIKRAYEQGCHYIGPTCHFVDEGVDTGKIISQAIFTTDVSMDEAVIKMFRMGCIVLLNSIQSVLKEDVVISQSASSKQLMFSPALKFDHEYYTEAFWTELATL